MKRVVPLGLIAAVAVAVGFGLLDSSGRWTAGSRAGAGVAETDSIWYHASDVALLATTGRPQLVEFFHPD